MLHGSYPTKPFINDVINKEAIKHRDRIVGHDNYPLVNRRLERH
jgi:hypothetical protein